MEHLNSNLEKIGLSDKEAKVYLASLELGPANIQSLTDKSGIKRSTVYEMLDNLKSMGLIIESIKGKRKTYVASEPEKLKKNIHEKEQLLNQILPELRSLNNAGSIKPKITYYEGQAGLRQIYNLVLETTTKKVDWVSPIRSVMETVGEDFLEEYIEKRAKEKYWVRSVQITEEQVETYKYLNPKTFNETFRKVRFSPPGLDIPNAMAIWDNKVAIMSSRKEGFGFIIESEDLLRSMRVFYELLWNASKTWEEMFGDGEKKKESADENLHGQKPQKATEEDIYY